MWQLPALRVGKDGDLDARCAGDDFDEASVNMKIHKIANING